MRTNFISRIKFTSFDISTGVSGAILFCPVYHINQIVDISYDQYNHLIDICRTDKYSRTIDNNHLIVDRWVAKALINGTF